MRTLRQARLEADSRATQAQRYARFTRRDFNRIGNKLASPTGLAVAGTLGFVYKGLAAKGTGDDPLACVEQRLNEIDQTIERALGDLERSIKCLERQLEEADDGLSEQHRFDSTASAATGILSSIAISIVSRLVASKVADSSLAD